MLPVSPLAWPVKKKCIPWKGFLYEDKICMKKTKGVYIKKAKCVKKKKYMKKTKYKEDEICIKMIKDDDYI